MLTEDTDADKTKNAVEAFSEAFSKQSKKKSKNALNRQHLKIKWQYWTDKRTNFSSQRYCGTTKLIAENIGLFQ